MLLSKFSSVQSLSLVSLRPCGQHARLPCPSQTPETYSSSCPLSQWCHATVRGVCNFLGLSHCIKNLKGKMDQCYSSVLFGKQRKIHPLSMRLSQPKKHEEKRGTWLNLAPLFMCFFLLPLSLAYVNWASQEGCLFYLRFSFQSSDLPLFYFCGLFPSLSSSHCHSGLLFPILTT